MLWWNIHYMSNKIANHTRHPQVVEHTHCKNHSKLPSITVYRKPTHTDQYLQWASHHHLSAKHCALNTLTDRAKTVCSKPELLQKEMDHLRKALTHCKYPKWVLDRLERRLTKPTSQDNNYANTQGTTDAKPTTKEGKTKGH